MHRIISIGALVVLSAACIPKKSDKTTSPAPTPQGPTGGGKFVAAVMDDNFDETLDVFKGKIIGKYTLVCKDDDAETDTLATDFATLKQKVMADLQKNEDDCTMQEGLKLTKSPAFASISQYKNQWNAIFKNKGVNDANGNPVSNLTREIFNTISAIVGGEDDQYIYHGTEVASLIAYENPNVQLVLIHRELSSPGAAPEVTTCPTQQNIDLLTQLMTDPDVKKAYVEQPISGEQKYTDEVLAKHNVDFWNSSFGASTTAVMEQEIADAGCGILNYRAYMQASHDLNLAHVTYMREHGQYKSKALRINAFGNDGQEVSTNADGEECSMVYTLNVGAVDAQGQLASFSNRGACVDVFAPGVEIIVSAPEGFISSVSGTSFSSPLFLRYLTQTATPSSDYKALFDSFRHSRQVIAGVSGQVPPELIAANPDKVDGFALKKSAKLVPRPLVRPNPFRLRH